MAQAPNPITNSDTFITWKTKINQLKDFAVEQANIANQKLGRTETAADSHKLGGVEAVKYAKITDIPILDNMTTVFETVNTGDPIRYDSDIPFNKIVRITGDTTLEFETPENFVVPTSIVYIASSDTATVTLGSNVKWLTDELTEITGQHNIILTMRRIDNNWYVVDTRLDN